MGPFVVGVMLCRRPYSKDFGSHFNEHKINVSISSAPSRFSLLCSMILLSWTRDDILKSNLSTLVKPISSCGLVHPSDEPFGYQGEDACRAVEAAGCKVANKVLLMQAQLASLFSLDFCLHPNSPMTSDHLAAFLNKRYSTLFSCRHLRPSRPSSRRSPHSLRINFTFDQHTGPDAQDNGDNEETEYTTLQKQRSDKSNHFWELFQLELPQSSKRASKVS